MKTKLNISMRSKGRSHFLKQSFVILCAILFIFNVRAQKTLSAPYEGGKIEFEYYERDGIKIPHGSMNFQKEIENTPISKEILIEKGSNQDGLKEGEWIVIKETGIQRTIITLNYERGLLNGLVTIKHIPLSKYSSVQPTEYSYSFKNGYLIGEFDYLKYGHSYSYNFSENGKAIGIWKYVDENGSNPTLCLDFNTENSEDFEAYTIDILGRKEPYLYGGVLQFVTTLREIESIICNGRVKLPSIGDNDFGWVQPPIMDPYYD